MKLLASGLSGAQDYNNRILDYLKENQDAIGNEWAPIYQSQDNSGDFAVHFEWQIAQAFSGDELQLDEDWNSPYIVPDSGYLEYIPLQPTGENYFL